MPDHRFRRRRLALGLCAALAGLSAAATAEAETACKLRQLAELPITMIGSRPTVPVKINGHPAPFFIDSGAEFGTITLSWAKRLDVHDQVAPGSTLKGVGGVQALRYAKVDEFDLADLPLKHIDFFVAEAGLEPSVAGVVGENILGALDTEYDFANGVVRIFKPENCGGDFLAYWSDGKASVVPMQGTEREHRHIITDVTVNGQHMKALWDTGAPRSMLTKRSAARAGVTPTTGGAEFAGRMGGFGDKVSDSWIAPFDSFGVGGEQIKNTRLRFVDADTGEQDMLLGFDFFLSHRVYVANSQRKVYFTYNGGPVFRLDLAQIALQNVQGAAAAADSGAKPAEAAAGPDEPKDAAGYVRRASASSARLNFPAAIADLSKAIELEPADPEHYLQRAPMYLVTGQPARAIADYGEVLKRKPDNVAALVARGVLYVAANDTEHARADLSAALKAAPNDPALPLAVATAYSASGLHQDAQALYDRWLKEHPLPAGRRAETSPAVAQRVVALNGACWNRAVLKRDLDTALADCDAAIKLKPKAPPVLDSRGLVHLQRGDYDLAIADYDSALKLDPKQAGSLYARGLAKLKKGLAAEGQADEQAALALDAKVADLARRNGLVVDNAPAH
ncbi:MAG TPA: aspartyl protease family protein [Caulobacteraceae bacterium]